MKNNFSPKTRELFLWVRCCQYCGRGDLPLELHHIEHRTTNVKETAIILCKLCHETKIHLKEELLKITKEFYDNPKRKP